MGNRIRIFLGFAALAAPLVATAEECVQGHWNLVNHQYRQDGSVSSSRARSDRHCLTSDIFMDEYRSLDADGRVNFRGVSFQVQSGDDVSILWGMVGDPGFTAITGHFDEDGSLHTKGTGEDMAGRFEERFTMEFAADGLSYDMSMDRNYEKFGVWITPFNRLEAIYESDEVEPLQQSPVAFLAEAANEARVAGQLVILDGWALASIADTGEGVTIRFSSRYAGPDRWRELTWSDSTGVVTATEHEL